MLRVMLCQAGLWTQDDRGAGQSARGKWCQGRCWGQARACCIACCPTAASSCRADAAGQLQTCARRRPSGCGWWWSGRSCRPGCSTHSCTTGLQVDLQPAQEGYRQVARSQVRCFWLAHALLKPSACLMLTYLHDDRPQYTVLLPSGLDVHTAMVVLDREVQDAPVFTWQQVPEIQTLLYFALSEQTLDVLIEGATSGNRARPITLQARAAPRAA